MTAPAAERVIDQLIIHCSAVRPHQTSSARQIDAWHRQRGFCSPSGIHIGYHFVVRRDGTIEPGRPLSEAGAHCRGHNSHSIGICYEGGLDADGQPADTRTKQQREVLRSLINQLKKRYPHATIHGHNEFAHKACPCFDVADWLAQEAAR